MDTSPDALFNIDLSFFSKVASGTQADLIFTLELHCLDATSALNYDDRVLARVVVFC
jgi:hypothetical protein